MFEKLDIFMGDDIFLPMQQLNHLRRQGLEALEEEMLVRGNSQKQKNEISKIYRGQKNRQPRSFSQLLWRQKNSLQQWKRQMELRESCGLWNLSGVWFCSECGKWIHRLKKRGKNCFFIAANRSRPGT